MIYLKQLPMLGIGAKHTPTFTETLDRESVNKLNNSLQKWPTYVCEFISILHNSSECFLFARDSITCFVCIVSFIPQCVSLGGRKHNDPTLEVRKLKLRKWCSEKPSNLS